MSNFILIIILIIFYMLLIINEINCEIKNTKIKSETNIINNENKKENDKNIKEKSINKKIFRHIDENKLEKDYEEGDSKEELEYEQKHLEKVAEKLLYQQKKNNKKIKSKDVIDEVPEMPYMDFKDTDKVMKELKNHNEKIDKLSKQKHKFMNPKHKEGAMLFVELDVNNENTKTRFKIDKLIDLWKNMMLNAGLDAALYVISDHSLLFRVSKGWLVNDVIKFAVTRPEVTEVSLDSRKYTKKDFPDDIDENDL